MNLGYFLLIGFISGSTLLFIIIEIIGAILEKKEIRKNELKQLENEAKFNKEKEELLLQYGNLSITELAKQCGMPDNVYLDNHFRPHAKGAIPDPWTVYIPWNGMCYHCNPRCSGGVSRAYNIVNIKRYGSNAYRPCSKCVSLCTLPDTTWYQEFWPILDAIYKHGIKLRNDTKEAPAPYQTT